MPDFNVGHRMFDDKSYCELFLSHFAEVGNICKDRNELIQQLDVVGAYVRILVHDHDVVEEIVNWAA